MCRCILLIFVPLDKGDCRVAILVCLHGYRRVWVLVGLSAIEMGGVFEVEVKGYRLGVSAEYSR